MAISTIPTEEQKHLISKEYEIPPIGIREYLSNDGKQIWDDSYFEYYYLHTELKAYFEGYPSQLTGLSDEWRDYLEAKKGWFLAIYELIRKSWEYLTPFYKDKEGNVITPGLLAAEILEANCKGGLLPAIAGRLEIAPRRNYELSAKIAKAKRLGESNLNQLTKDCFRQWGEYKKAADLEVAVLSYCRYAATQDKYVKEAFKAYISASNKLSDVIHKHWGYAKRKQEIWEKGSRKSS